MGGHLAFAALGLTALGPVFTTGLRLDDVEKRWRQLDVS
jgi:hypothetical protein